jgi:hypothetical protein
MSFIAPIQGFSVTLAFPIGTGYQLNINQNMNISSIPSYVFNNVSTIYVNYGCVLTIDQNTTFPSNITGFAGPGTITINSGITLTINQNIDCTLSTINGAGTLQINSGYTFNFSGNNLNPSGLVANGILALSGNYTLGTNITNGSGNLQINSGFTLTVSSNLTLGFTSIKGSGALTISSGYTLTQGSNLVLDIPQINLNGTWANAGYQIVVDSGITQYWYVSGSITTGTTAGLFSINGTVFWYGNGIGAQTSSAVPTFPLKFGGTGIFMGCPTSTKGTATNTISLSAYTLNAGSSSGTTNTASGLIPYITFSSIQGSSAGSYGIGIKDTTTTKFYVWILIYLGSTSAFTNMSGLNWNYTAADTSGDTIAVHNATGGAGSITLTCTAYV